MKGKVYLVGAGPGDAGLITVKGAECIKKADTILYDNLTNEELLKEIRADAKIIYVGKKGNLHEKEQHQINRMLHNEAKNGKVVVRLKGGDPFIFGRGSEEAEYLKSKGTPFEVVPGVTAAIGASAYAGIPLTHRDISSAVTFVTGHATSGKDFGTDFWANMPKENTLVIYMGVKNLKPITDTLRNHGWEPKTSVALIEWGTLTRQRVVQGDLTNIVSKAKKYALKPPAIAVIGKVVKLRDKLKWFENKPLFNKKIVITRSREQASELRKRLEDLGAEVIEIPAIAIEKPKSWKEINKAIADLKRYDGIIFTSANGVEIFLERIKGLGKDFRILNNNLICAIGPATAKKLEMFNIKADIVADNFTSEGLAKKLAQAGIKGKCFLHPCADINRGVLKKELAHLRANIDEVIAYHITKPPKSNGMDIGRADIIVFASSQTVRNFVDVIGKKHIKDIKARIACIGPITASTVREYGLKPSITPKRYTIPDLVDTIVAAN